MNYRHAFHAGNFADVMKHAILLQLVARLAGEGRRLVLDTHAGAGVFDLQGEAARRSGEAEAGVVRLMAASDAPGAFAPLIAAVRRANPDGGLRWYPGSPRLIVEALGAGDRYIGCELRPDDGHALAQSLRAPAAARGVRTEVRLEDGFAAAGAVLLGDAPALVFIDPPFESGDDYARILELAAIHRDASHALVVWTPLKDLETFDALLRGLEASGRQVVVAEVRLRPLDQPMRMNGCALLMIGAPDVTPAAEAICGWVAAEHGEVGALGRIYSL